MVAPAGFEPASTDPESAILDHCTKELYNFNLEMFLYLLHFNK
jgi:hypothetical protein